LIIQAIRHEEGMMMPPKGKLEDREVAALVSWVKAGAVWPEGMKLSGDAPELRSGPITAAERAFWSFQPITDPQPPAVDAAAVVRNDIDRFVIAKLAATGLTMRSPADKRMLLRRASFDLTGLPPTPSDVDSFLKDESPEAFSKVVDRLLGSKAYGERWGRHWLDVVRYADTAGETADYPAPLAYQYRNWVINAVNADMPYDEFLREQLAGDILGQEMISKLSGPPDAAALEKYRQMLIATGFIAISRRFGFDVENYHNLTIQDTIDTVGQAVLGLTLGCARCHDHKFDPVSGKDYYALYGIFDSTRYSFPGSEEKKRPYDSFPALPPDLAASRKAEFDAQLAKIEADIKQLEGEKTALATGLATVVGSSGYNGFEMETIGQPPIKPWSTLAKVTVTETSQSPFNNVFPLGTRGLAFPNNIDNNAFVRTLDPVHKAETTPLLYYSIDFRNTSPAETGPGSYRFYVGHGPGASPAVEIGINGEALRAKSGAKYEVIREIKPGQWYNLQLALDLRTKTYSGTLGFPGDVTPFKDLAFSDGWDGLIDTTFVDRYGPTGGTLPAHEVDNLVIGTAPFAAVDKSIDNAEQRANEVRTLLAKSDGLNSQLVALMTQRDQLKKSGPYDTVFGAIEKDKPTNAQMQLRGEKLKLGDTVPRRNLEILGGEPVPENTGSGRLQLAQWLTRPDNPLTPRVMVNRIWEQHFGHGIVSTENDFGSRGQRPTHPELLDWLATRFVQSGWSLKAMHRLIMNSATYQQTSAYDPKAAEMDPDAKLLWRFNRRRLSAEEIRDAMLFVSGDLDPTMGAEHPFPPVESWGFSQHGPYYGVYATNRRSIYLMQQRLKKHPFLGLFDGADTNVSTARRELTTVPTQALYLMNNEFVHERSASLAKQIVATTTTDPQRVNDLFVSALGRPPTAEETADSTAFLASYEQALASGTPEQRRQTAWSALVRTILTRNEFLFVD
ncbi:MAG: Protein of unknown function (DUF1553)/Protein of unknown function (DUF1549)/Planctomycete, partial [Planctomycetaceae bacterium]|nr:Protein of unknown function (DUF1553)/Protein of unknown function (DUF1549)/Planctomycete [Planctomycetaceae bacterium]